MIYLVAAFLICMALHLSVMALLAHSLGIKVRQVSYGLGPALLQWRFIRINAIPLSGYVKLKDSRVEALEMEDCSDAFDCQPVWKQVAVSVAGAGSLVLMGVAGLGAEGWSSFQRGFAQIFLGALPPFDAAQSYLRSFAAFAGTHSFLAVLALVSSKFAALNFLPFRPFNGGQALADLLSLSRVAPKLDDQLMKCGILLALLLLVGWSLAILSYFGGSA